jgi:hypothetical protein
MGRSIPSIALRVKLLPYEGFVLGDRPFECRCAFYTKKAEETAEPAS